MGILLPMPKCDFIDLLLRTPLGGCFYILMPYIQTLRFSRAFSSGKDINSHDFYMKACFKARGYQAIVINNRIDEVVFRKNESFKKTSEIGIHF